MRSFKLNHPLAGRKSPFKPIFVVVTVLILGSLVTGYLSQSLQYPGESVNCTVTDKDRAKNADGASDMRVYTSCGVFRVADSFVQLRFDSADRYSRILVGEAYDFEAVGFRVPLLSWFPNILTATPSQVSR